MNENPDSYSSLERRFLVPARKLLLTIYHPFIRALAALRITPNLISFAQIPVGVIAVALMPSQPRVAFILFVAAIMLDGIDGALARATNRASAFGALFDQYCDHVREVVVVAGLALHGALNGFLAGLYGLAYVGLNITLYICNQQRVPAPFALKSYAIVYPAIFLFLWFRVDFLDDAVALYIAFTIVTVAFALRRLKSAMEK